MRGETLSGHPFCSLSCTVGHRLGCGSGVRNFDIQTHTKAGKVIWLNVRSLPVPSGKKDRFLFAHLFRDITTRCRSIGSPPLYRGARHPPALPLSEREREVLRLLAGGKTSQGIADALYISSVTVRNHI